MLELLFCAFLATIYITGAALVVWAIKASGLGAWMATTWLGELTRPLWEIKQDNE